MTAREPSAVESRLKPSKGRRGSRDGSHPPGHATSLAALEHGDVELVKWTGRQIELILAPGTPPEATAGRGRVMIVRKPP